MAPGQPSENQVARILAEALELPVAARGEYLDSACAGDAALRAEVESLLAADAQAGHFMEAKNPVALPGAPMVEKAGDRIGRYKLLEEIGEGGFGVVWMAEQEEPVRRLVAVKIIKLGMDTREVVARFEAERQALAIMDHPNIATVFDGGATDTGRPYFVMELVKGVPITEYCDANKLAPADRLRLLMQVCEAVQHAHLKGIIHRDLKPSNILVTVKDGQPVPKVIDFGVAKATQARLTEKTLFTRFNQWIGTPAYMSPEQAGLSSLDVDTRSDVYSLGVVLYELLTGRTPFDSQRLLEKGYEAILRTIREEEPPKPSTRISTLLEAELADVAIRRGAEPKRLHRLVRGDLDWIAMKALDKDRTRRYESAGALARDLQLHLQHQPVLAAAPGIGYRLAKFVRRNQAIMARTAAAFAVGGLAVTAVLWIVNGRGPRWLPDIRPGARPVNTPPHLDFEHAISDVYVQDYSVTGPGVRMIGSERHLFIRTGQGAGGWKVFEPGQRRLLPQESNSLAYVVGPGSASVFELLLGENGLACGSWPTGQPTIVTPQPGSVPELRKLIAVPTVIEGLVVCALPDAGIVFALEPRTGALVWTNTVMLHNRDFRRIGHIAADPQLVVAGLWGSRLWALDTRTGKHCWSRDTDNVGNSIFPLLGSQTVFGFSASGTAFGFEKATGRQLWENPVGRCESGDEAVLHGSNVLVKVPSKDPTTKPLLVALSQADGTEQWQIPLVAKDQSGVLSVSGDLVVVSAGRFLQRIDAVAGLPGSFLELPTLKPAVLLRGREVPIYVSHPLVLTSPDTVCAFTVDGSLWCAHLPTLNTNVARPSSEKTVRSTQPAPEQMPTTNRPTPPLPMELQPWREQLQKEGRGNLWTQLEAAIDQKWIEAQNYARAFAGIPRVVIGRVVVPSGEDPRFVQAQMAIMDGGYFVSAVRDLETPLCFRLPGCLPVDFPLKGRSGDLVFLGDVTLPIAAPEQLGALAGRIVTEGRLPPDARVIAGLETGPINHFSNGYELRPFHPDPVIAEVKTNGEFLLHGLSPAGHHLSITAEDCLGVTRSVLVTPGRTNHLGLIRLQPSVPVKLSWVVSDRPSFVNLIPKSGLVRPGELIPISSYERGNDLRIHVTEHGLRFGAFYAASRIIDLGVQSLVSTQVFDVASLPLVPVDCEVRAGHVYLSHVRKSEPGYWVLLRVDAIGDYRPAPKPSAAAEAAAEPVRMDPLAAKVAGAIAQLRGKFNEQTAALNKLYALLEPALSELEAQQAEELKAQRQKALEVQQAIPPRSSLARVQLVNLNSNYNAALSMNWHGDERGNNLAEVPKGIHKHDGVEFDVRGIVQPPPLEPDNAPGLLTNILVQQSCRRLHFLHAAIFAGGLPDQTEIGRYIVHYEQGPDVVIPLRAGIELADWWKTPGDADPRVPAGWVGLNEKARKHENCSVRLFHLAWENPRPGETVRAISIATTHEEACPFLVALTVE